MNLLLLGLRVATVLLAALLTNDLLLQITNR